MKRTPFEQFIADGQFWRPDATWTELDLAMEHGLIGPWAARTHAGKQRLVGVLTRFTRMLELTRSLVAALEEDDVDCVVLKGVTVAAWWQQPASRPQADVDVLVEPANFERAIASWKQRGLIEAPKAEPREHFHQQLISTRVSDAPIELHDGLSVDFPIGVSVSELIARRRRVTVEGLALPALSEPDELIYLCLHATTHGAAPLRWLFDLHQLAERTSWPSVMETARAWSCTRPTWWALREVSRRLGAPVPSSLERALEPPRRVLARLELLERMPFDERTRLRLRRLALLRLSQLPGVLRQKRA